MCASALIQVSTVSALAEVPGCAHGFERRGPWSTGESRAAARQRVEQALAPLGRVLFLTQVHGATVCHAPWAGAPAADAAVLSTPGILAGIETADCLPVLLVDPQRRVAAAVHAGWRGSAAGVTNQALEALLQCGCRAEDIRAALGPAIGPCCYEVGEELRERFGPDCAPFFERRASGRWSLDLRALNEWQLAQRGVRASQIHHLRECTACHPDRYCSYRRDGPGGGRMVSFVGWTSVEL